MTYHRPGRSTGFLAFALFAASACSIAPGASSVAPGARGTPAASEACHQLDIPAGQSGETIGNLRKDATDIVVGVFGGYGEAEWNTPDGHRPSAQEVQEKTARLIRPISIELKGQIRGARTAAEHAIVRGGELGCDKVTYFDDIPLIVGQRYLFFMLPLLDSEDQRSDKLLVLAAWPVGKSDVVTTPHEGDMSLADVKKGIDEGPKPAETPNPNEPWPSGPG